MKKEKIIVLVIVVVVIVLIGIFYKFNDILVPLIFRNEQLGMYEIEKMQGCKNLEEKNLVLNEGDFQVILPLPKGAVMFKNDTYPNDNQYLISIKHADLEDYINTTLPGNDFTAERLGGMVIIKDNKNDINITMYIEMYTTNFKRLTYRITNEPAQNDADSQEKHENMKATLTAVVVDPESLMVWGIDIGLHGVRYPNKEKLELKQGQEILIYFDGTIAETYPGKILNVGDIKIIKEKSDVEIPESAMRYCFSRDTNVSVSLKRLTKTGISLDIIDNNQYPFEYTKKYTIAKKNKEAEKNINKTTETQQNFVATSNTTSTNITTTLPYIPNNNEYVPLWEEAPRISNKSIEETTILDVSEDGKNVSITCDWSTIYGELEEGEYIFDLLISDLALDIVVEFTIDANGNLTYSEPRFEV